MRTEMSWNVLYGLLFVILIMLVGCSPCCSEDAAVGSSKPNIIFILTDDQRADTLGCLGNSLIRTPNLDKLAGEGVLFEKAAVTSAICMPSRVSYFLGQYERRHGVNFNSGTAVSEAAWQNSFPVILHNAGYFTGYVGKNHCPVGPKGYDSGIMEQAFDYWYAAHGHIGFYLKKDYPKAAPVFKNAKADTQVEILEEGVMNFFETNSDFVKGAEEFLAERPKDKPFCLSICFNLPHDCSTEKMKQLPTDPETYRSLYRDKEIPLNANYVAKDNITTPKIPADILHAAYRQGTYRYVDTPEDCKERVLRTYQAITGIDQLVGHLRQKLAELDLDDNTIIVFTSDHGIMQGEFGLGGKALNYEKCLNVPMIVYSPLHTTPHRGVRSRALVQSIDVAPTLLDAAGVAVPGAMQGASMMPLLQSPTPGWRRYAFAENLWSNRFGNPRVESVRDQRWKYIRYFKHDASVYDRSLKGAAEYQVSAKMAQDYRAKLTASIEGEPPVYEELFDLEKDPQETTNLAADAKYKSVLQRMRKACQREVKKARGKGDNLAGVDFLSH